MIPTEAVYKKDIKKFGGFGNKLRTVFTANLKPAIIPGNVERISHRDNMWIQLNYSEFAIWMMAVAPLGLSIHRPDRSTRSRAGVA